MASTVYVIAIGIAYALWRRCYGGWDSDLWKKFFPKFGSALHRWFWRCVNLVAVFSLCFFCRDIGFWWSVYTALIAQFVLWDWTFGMYMEIGRHPVPPSQEDVDEYERQLFAPLLGWLVREESRYGEFYDYLGMAFRFSVPGLLVWLAPTFGIGMCFLGLLVATSYLAGIRYSETRSAMPFWQANFSELVSGFFAGVLLAVA